MMHAAHARGFGRRDAVQILSTLNNLLKQQQTPVPSARACLARRE